MATTTTTAAPASRNRNDAFVRAAARGREHARDVLAARLAARLRRFFAAQARRIVDRFLALAPALAAGVGAGLSVAPLRCSSAPKMLTPDEMSILGGDEHLRLSVAIRADFSSDPASATSAIVSAIITPATTEAEAAQLAALIRPLAQALLIVADEQAAAAVGLAPLVADDPRIRAHLAAAVYYPDGISPTTATALQRIIDEGMRRHYSAYQIAHGVPRDGFAGLVAELEGIGARRAETISRTVMAFASQQAAHDRYDEGGVIEVDIIDGPGCGWTRHDDPDKAHGTRRSLAAARQYPISHPNCRRVSLPVLSSRTRSAS